MTKENIARIRFASTSALGAAALDDCGIDGADLMAAWSNEGNEPQCKNPDESGGAENMASFPEGGERDSDGSNRKRHANRAEHSSDLTERSTGLSHCRRCEGNATEWKGAASGFGKCECGRKSKPPNP